MAYELVIQEAPGKDVGDNVFLQNLPAEYKVYLFYYPGAMPDERLEKALRNLGEMTGKNLFVNIGRLNDPEHEKIVGRFEIKNYPVILITAVGSLAAPQGEFCSAYARLDSKRLLGSPERTVECVQELFNLFLRGEVAKAISQAKWKQRAELAAVLGRYITDALKGLKDFVASRDISISFLEGKFELKRSGG